MPWSLLAGWCLLPTWLCAVSSLLLHDALAFCVLEAPLLLSSSACVLCLLLARSGFIFAFAAVAHVLRRWCRFPRLRRRGSTCRGSGLCAALLLLLHVACSLKTVVAQRCSTLAYPSATPKG